MQDSFKIQLKDKAKPPNVSGHYMVHINVSGRDRIALLCIRKCLRKLQIMESSVGVITKDMLAYADVRCDKADVIYNVLPELGNANIDNSPGN